MENNVILKKLELLKKIQTASENIKNIRKFADNIHKVEIKQVISIEGHYSIDGSSILSFQNKEDAIAMFIDNSLETQIIIKEDLERQYKETIQINIG